MKCMIPLLLAAALFPAGCHQEDSSEIRVGVNLPLSDSLESYGKNVLAGVQLRVDQINGAGGLNGKKVVLVTLDNKGDKTSARNAFEKLAQVDRVVAVIGPITSTNALAVKMDAERCKVPMMTPTATNDAVTQGTHYAFRACYNDTFQGTVVANEVLKELKLTKAAVMTDQSSDYSKGLSAIFKKVFQAAGGQIVAEEGFQQKDTDFGAQLVNIKNKGAEIIFVPAYPPEVPLIIKQAKVVGFPGQLCGPDGWDDQAVLSQAGDKIEGCFYVAAFSPEDDRPIVKEFIAARKAVSGRAPGSFEALGYDSMLLLAEALRRNSGQALKAGSSPEAVARGLRGLKDVEAVTGRITIDPQGDAIKQAAVLKVVRDGDRFAPRCVRMVAATNVE